MDIGKKIVIFAAREIGLGDTGVFFGGVVVPFRFVCRIGWADGKRSVLVLSGIREAMVDGIGRSISFVFIDGTQITVPPSMFLYWSEEKTI